jgi:hypothetical protein
MERWRERRKRQRQTPTTTRNLSKSSKDTARKITGNSRVQGTETEHTNEGDTDFPFLVAREYYDSLVSTNREFISIRTSFLGTAVNYFTSKIHITFEHSRSILLCWEEVDR